MQTCKQSQLSSRFLFSSFASGRCGKFISSFLITIFFVSCLIIPSSASSGNLITTNMTTSPWYWDSNYNTGLPSMSYSEANGNVFSWTDINVTNMLCAREVNLNNFNPQHTYNFSFQSYGSFNKSSCDIFVCFNGNTSSQEGHGLYKLATLTFSNNSQWHNYNLSFVPSQLHNGSFTSFILCFLFYSPSSSNVNSSIRIKNPTLVDTDDNDGLLESILDWISRVYHSIAGGTDSTGVVHTGIVQGISNAIQNISTWLSNLGDAIKNKLESVKNSIIGSIEAIEDWFVQLGEDIIDGLESLFVPSDSFIESWRSGMDSFMLEHFGAIYQMPQIFINFMRKLVTIDTGNGVIHLPAVQFTWQGQVHTLIEAQDYSFNWVNDNDNPLHYIYVFYRAFSYVILFIGMGNYCINKYNKLFGGISDDS